MAIPCPSAGVYKILGIAEYIPYSFRFGLMHFSTYPQYLPFLCPNLLLTYFVYENLPIWRNNFNWYPILHVRTNRRKFPWIVSISSWTVRNWIPTAFSTIPLNVRKFKKFVKILKLKYIPYTYSPSNEHWERRVLVGWWDHAAQH